MSSSQPASQQVSQRGQGRQSATGPQVFEVRLDSRGPWTLPGIEQRNLITLHYFDGKIRQTLHLRFILVLLTSCQSSGKFTTAHWHVHALTHTHAGSYQMRSGAHFRLSYKEHIHLFLVWCILISLFVSSHTHTFRFNISSASLRLLSAETSAVKSWCV